MVIYLFTDFFDMNFATEIFQTKNMENNKEIKGKKDLNEKKNLNGLKQFIQKNKKENLILKKILKKINQSSEKDEQDD